MYWNLAGVAIISEDRYPEAESYRRCESGELTDGWWIGLGLPEPRDLVVTGEIETPTGRLISIHNGTPALEELVRSGLEKFTAAGLTEPQVDSVTFEPTRRCQGVSGRISEFVDSRDLVLCVYESDFCPDPADCGVPALGPRIILLHELGHAWMLDDVDSGTRQQVLEASGRESWTGNDVPWGERGVEYAAQILAWGLVSDEVRLIELGEPPCAEATAVFEILTGIAPPAPRCRS